MERSAEWWAWHICGYIWAPQLVYLKIKPIHFPFLMLSLLSSFFINTTHPPKIGSHKTSNRKTLSGLNHIVLASVVLKASKFLLQDEGRMHFSSIAFSCARKLRVSCRSLRYVLGLTSLWTRKNLLSIHFYWNFLQESRINQHRTHPKYWEFNSISQNPKFSHTLRRVWGWGVDMMAAYTTSLLTLRACLWY